MRLLPAALCVACIGTAAMAEPFAWGFDVYGRPGLIDMPQALPLPDGELAFTSSRFSSFDRHTLTFQIAPRLTGSFRYSLLGNMAPSVPGGFTEDFDRSFSLQFLIAPETRHMPAFALGLNDFLGTGLFASEYLVATRTITPTLRATAGIGWGRLAGVGGFDNPLGIFGDSWRTRERSVMSDGLGGKPLYDTWFRGPAAWFGGLEWRPHEDWLLAVEYSPDAYPRETQRTMFERHSQVNFGLRYRVSDRWTVGANYLYGSELGLQLTYQTNPARPRYPSGIETRPPLVQAAGDLPATMNPNIRRARAALAREGIDLLGLRIDGDIARVEIGNSRWRESAQALGRAARVLSGALPPAVERITLTLVERGMPVTSTTMRRADLEELEFAFDGAWQMQARAGIEAAAPGLAPLPDTWPRFSWGIAPYVSPALFDPDAPLRADLGVEVSAQWEPAPGVILSGAMRHPLLGNLDESTRASNSILPHVRSDAWLYDKADFPITRLTGAWYFRPGHDLYGRVTAGLLEPMFAGVSAELLYYPAGSRFALGAEIAHVAQRDYDQGFDLRDYEVTTGHASLYWDMGNGYHAQADLGRYLAGDWGGTLSLDREFGNGWRVGAYMTLTDVSFADFGEGSFDKGLRLTIPLDWIDGRPRREASDFTIQPILRDGGARLNVEGRLYEVLRPAGGAAISDGWARFWR